MAYIESIGNTAYAVFRPLKIEYRGGLTMEPKITSAVRQGTRDYQEDRYCIMNVRLPAKTGEVVGTLLAVMDGHGGVSVARYCAEHIPDLFRLHALDKSEEALRNLVADLNFITDRSQDGSTLSAALVLYEPRIVSVAILGDSPVVVYDGSGKIHVSPEHNVRTNMEERRAAEERGGSCHGGYVYNKEGIGLQMSRSLGDARLGTIISREPEIYSIADPQWVLVASDGIFDPSHTGYNARFHSGMHDLAARKASADDVVTWAEELRRGLSDNATALVWHSQT
mgnify:CR=1 FL=1